MKWKKCNQCGEQTLPDFKYCITCCVTDAFNKYGIVEIGEEE